MKDGEVITQQPTARTGKHVLHKVPVLTLCSKPSGSNVVVPLSTISADIVVGIVMINVTKLA